MPEIDYNNMPMGEARMECSLIGDVEKAELLESLHIAKMVHRKAIKRYKQSYDRFNESLIYSHTRSVMRIETLEKVIGDIPTPKD
jgi:hypothetical protein